MQSRKMSSILRVKTLEESIRCPQLQSTERSRAKRLSVRTSCTVRSSCISSDDLIQLDHQEQEEEYLPAPPPPPPPSMEDKHQTEESEHDTVSNQSFDEEGREHSSASHVVTTDHARPTSQQALTFGTVTIREYPRIIGDNPSCNGCPVGINWVHIKQVEIAFDDYEIHREGVRRVCSELKIPHDVRHDMMVEWGATTKQIFQVRKEMVEIQKQRMKSAAENTLFLAAKEKLRGLIIIKPFKGCCCKPKVWARV